MSLKEEYEECILCRQPYSAVLSVGCKKCFGHENKSKHLTFCVVCYVTKHSPYTIAKVAICDDCLSTLQLR